MLAEYLTMLAQWRRSRYDDDLRDRRNLIAAEAIEDLSRHILSLPDDDPRLLELEKTMRRGDVLEPGQQTAYELSRLRFFTPETELDAFLTHLVDIAQADFNEHGRFGGTQVPGDEPWRNRPATDRTWEDVVLQVAPELAWGDGLEVLSGSSGDAPVQEALKKSTILWMRWEAGSEKHTMPVWFVNDKGRIYVLSGERQQTLPGAAELRECDVIVRWKGKNVRIAEIPAAVKVIEPGPEWDQAAEKIAEKRLNIPGLPEETARRWREECIILELILRD